MSELLDFPQLFVEDADRVRTRMDADANGGVDPNTPGYIDTREGSFYFDLTQVSLLEILRLWDAFTEAVAAAFPLFAWGEYLDHHASTFGLTRNPAKAATGGLLFTTSQGGVTIPTNTLVASTPSDPAGDTIVFQTTESGVTVAQLSAPPGVTVTPSTTGGSLTPATYIYHVTAYNHYGETVGSPDHSGVITTSTGKNVIAWTAVSGADGYRVYRTMTASTLGQLMADVANANLVATPLSTSSSSGWSTSAGNGIGAGASLSMVTAPAPKVGDHVAQITTTNTNANEGITYLLPSPVAQTYTYQLWMRGNAGAEQVAIGLAVPGTGLVDQTNVTLTTAWQLVTLQFTLTGPQASANPYIAIFTQGSTAYTFFVNDVRLVATTWTDIGIVTPGALEPSYNSTAGVVLDSVCTATGADGNLAPNALDSLDTPIPFVVAVTNPSPMVGGADPEEDDALRDRILAQFQSHGGGTKADYERWSLAFGAERVSVVPLFSGPGTVLVVSMQADGSPVSTADVTALQNFLDPVAGQGHGQAPIGASVTVATTAVLSAAVSASVTFEPGYSLDGSDGGIPRRGAITDSLSAYIKSLQPGDTLVYQHVQAAFFVAGVHSVAGLTVNGGTADITLATTPVPQIAQLATPTLS